MLEICQSQALPREDRQLRYIKKEVKAFTFKHKPKHESYFMVWLSLTPDVNERE